MADELELLRRIFDADQAICLEDDLEGIKRHLRSSTQVDRQRHLEGAVRRDRSQSRKTWTPKRAALGGGVVSLVLVVIGGNLAAANATPASVPAEPVALPTKSWAPGTFVPVARTSRPSSVVLYLAVDATGRSLGCVSLGRANQLPPRSLPDSLGDAAPSGTICAFPPPKGAGSSSPGIGYEVTLPSANSVAAPTSSTAFGFVPAGTTTVDLVLERLWPTVFRLLSPTVMVRARVFGESLGLPIEAWWGPDLSGYSVRDIVAAGPNGDILARLNFS